MFDYMKILAAYIRHVGEIEGVDFLSRSEGQAIYGLSLEETKELLRISDTSYDSVKPV